MFDHCFVRVNDGKHAGLGGWVAEMRTSELSGKARLRIVDFVREIDDLEAGVWVDASNCEELS
jgi:hypothetical protein